ncbi:MAG: lipid-A-disaccharide synthase [Rhodobacterales bacterium]|nr:MAG: lipid-A-disaccharide synthase [Rhodobacterales bacterium]
MKAFLIAGEASGDKLGGALMAGLRQIGPLQASGVGGAEMAGQGLSSLFPMSDLSVMGLAEVLPRYRQLKRRIREAAQAVIDTAPDVLITIDSPDFCLRVAKIVKAARPDLPIIHYVAPSVWAWRPGRAAKMARVVDHVLALLPFEPPYMHAAGLSCDFVGHPVVADPAADPAQVAALKAEGDGPILCVLPGSRRGEVTRLAPVFGATLTRLNWEGRVIVPVAPGLEELVAQQVASWPVTPRLVLPGEGLRKQSVLAASDLALAASGTVSLELAKAGTPMVIAYDMAWLSRQIMSRMVRIDTVTLVNLVSETRAVPEFIGARCRPELIAPALDAVRHDPAAQTKAMSLTMERLGAGGEAPGLRAARSVAAFLDRA